MADRAQPVIRKVEPRRIADFDDQLWPINCAILILAGFAAGIAVATGDWHAENLLYNTFFRLALVALAVGVLLAAVVWLQGRMIRRVQLCVLASLLAHLWVGLYLHQQYIMTAQQQESEAARSITEDDPRLVVPEYHWENIERPESRHTFEEPVEVEAPRPTDPEPPKPQEVEHNVPVEKEPTTLPEPPRPQQPNPAEMQRAELTAPRRAPLAAGAQISRQEWKHQSEPNEPIPEPEAAPRAGALSTEPEAQLAGPQRRPSESARPQREMTELAPQATRPQEEMKLARAVPPAAEPSPDVPTTPTPTRQLRNPAELAQTDLKTPAAVPPADQTAQAPPAMSAAEEQATEASRSAASPLTPARAEPAGQSLPAVGQTPQLPQSQARRSEAAREEPTVAQDAAAEPGTLARDASGIDLPSTVLPGPQAAPAPTAVGGNPGSLVETVGELPVTRSPAAAPLGARAAATGEAELAVGSGEVMARPGLPHAAGADLPSVASSESAARIARSETSGSTAASLPVEASLSAPPGAPAASQGAAPRLTPNSQASALAHGGSPAVQASRPNTGSGPVVGQSGAPDRVGAAQLARVTRYESLPSNVSAGGAPSPSRSSGLTIAPPATVDMPQVSAAAPLAGQPGGSPLAAQHSTESRQGEGGLPGSLAAHARSGAVAALATQGEPLPAAVARRAEASETVAGGSGTGPATTATVTRADRGLRVPSATTAIDEPPQPGGGGVALAEGAAASRLDVGPTASVRHSAGSGAIGAKAAPASNASVGIGSGSRATLAGRVRAGQEGLPRLEGTAPTASVGRSTASGPMIGGELVAELPETVPAATPSGTGSGGSPVLAVQPSGASRVGSASGMVSREMTAGEPAPWGPPSTTPGLTAGPRRVASGGGTGPSLAAETGGGPLRKTDTAGLLPGLADALAGEPAATVGPAAASGSSGEVRLAAGIEETVPARQNGGLPVQITAKPGPGGLSYEASAQVGIPSHRARPESEVVHSAPRRFLMERSGGRLAIDSQTIEGPTAAFRQREPGPKAHSIEIYGGTEGTEQAVELGLEFLVRCQFPDGHWSLSSLPEGTPPDDWALGQMRSDTAATGLALLSFFGAGYTHQSDKHRVTIRRGLEWLLGQQKPNGDLYTGGSDYTWFYSHGIAAIAVCEAYGMTRDPQLREPAEKAIQFIVASQEPTRGGWRYEPRVESDTSVSGWQLMALKSAQMAGLKVPQATLDRVATWLDSAQTAGGARYIYNPYAGNTPEQREGRRPNLAMTAEGSLMRMYLGWPGDHPALVDAAEYLKQNLPAIGTDRQPTRNAYYWYYATQVMFQMQGPYWEAWNNRLHPLLESSQAQTGPLAGSWHPLAPVRDRWGEAGGRLYVTTMNLLMLEVYYRHLPLFQTLER